VSIAILLGLEMKRIDKRIRYLDHALERFAERGISRDQAAQVLRDPDAERPAKNRAARRFEKALSKRSRLVVIAEEKAAEFWVITAWWKR
jgi:uncharacterized protein DUF4258